VALTALLAFAVTLSAEPRALTLGRDATAKVEIRVTGAFGRRLPGARVTLSTNLGSVSAPEAAGDGTFTASFTPPRSRTPSVAILSADAELEGEHDIGWLALPLSGSDSMTVETRPHSAVVLRILDRTFGPVIADDRGLARIEVVVPPGVAKATMHVEDKLGNTTDRTLNLDPPPFVQMRAVAVGPPQASWDEPLEIEVFTVRRDGTPDPNAEVTGSSERGEVEVSGHGAGVTTLSFRPAPGASGPALVSVETEEERAELRALVVAPSGRGGRGALARLKPWAISAGVLGSAGATFHGAIGFAGSGQVAVRLAATPFEALLESGGAGWLSFDEPAPGAFPGRSESASPSAVLAQLGVRGSRELRRGLDVHASLLFGGQRTAVSATVYGPPAQAARSDSGFAPRVTLAAGVAWWLGPGRAVVQLQSVYAPSAGGLDVGLGGLGLQFGYLFSLQR